MGDVQRKEMKIEENKRESSFTFRKHVQECYLSSVSSLVAKLGSLGIKDLVYNVEKNTKKKKCQDCFQPNQLDRL